MDPIFELFLTLPPRGSSNVLRALHNQIRAAIVKGTHTHSAVIREDDYDSEFRYIG